MCFHKEDAHGYSLEFHGYSCSTVGQACFAQQDVPLTRNLQAEVSESAVRASEEGIAVDQKIIFYCLSIIGQAQG